MIEAYNVVFAGFHGDKQQIQIIGKRQFKNNQQLKAFRKKEASMLTPKNGILTAKEVSSCVVMNPEKL